MKVSEKQACHVMLKDQLSFIDFRGDHMVLWLNRSGIICRQIFVQTRLVGEMYHVTVHKSF